MLRVMAHETLRLTTPPRTARPKVPPEGTAAISPGFHTFQAFAFAENLSLRDLAPAYPGGLRSAQDLRIALDGAGSLFLYPFGAIVFRDVSPARCENEIARLRALLPRLASPVVQEAFTVRVDPAAPIQVSESLLVIDRLTAERESVVAHTTAQSAAMEYYEEIVDRMFTDVEAMVDRLEKSGTVSLRTRPLHRFIGRAVGIRNEVLAVLHLLDKPDATWEDPGMDRIYDDLRKEFDLADRFSALETKLRGVQEALELVLDVARDRRLVLLDASILVLIVIEVILGLVR
jgi:uncharacterized Rmd1/YagE family protein